MAAAGLRSGNFSASWKLSTVEKRSPFSTNGVGAALQSKLTPIHS
jgi:hypothetical protein